MSSKRLLEGKIALITGASRGLGLATLKRYALEGANIFANTDEADSINDLCADLEKEHSVQIKPCYFDVRDKSAVKECFGLINKSYGKLDILVNNAGVMKDALLGTITDEIISYVYSVNVFAGINLMQYAVKLMYRAGSGSIINLSSIVGVEGNAGQIVYAGTKGAIIAMTKSAAKELAPKNIRVNAIAPGFIDTDMFRSIGEERVVDYTKKIGFKRLGEPDEIAKTAVFLGSDLSSYVTGQIIGVNGSTVI